MEMNSLVKKSLELARQLQSQALQKSSTSAFSKRLKPLLHYPSAKAFLIHVLDVAFRSSNYTMVALFIRRLFGNSSQHWVLFTFWEQKLIGIFQSLGYLFPNISIPMMRKRIAGVAENVVFVKSSTTFEKHVALRRLEGISLNINLIGEALMGEGEAEERIEKYRQLLRDPNVDYVSVKISTIYSQIDSLAYEKTLEVLRQRLTILYQELVEIHRERGQWKFINLDMEEYRDLSLTVDTFIATLSLPEFTLLRAGIVLQAYIPDSYQYLLKLQDWAQERVSKGGAPIKIRVVKGANMEMEKTESSTHGWPLVTYDQKVDTDANYKKMLLALLNSKSCESIHVGVASHNVFDLAFAISMVKEHGVTAKVDFEMLEGMAGALSAEVLLQGVNVLLYTPLVEEHNFMSAIAYLVRRLDEGTADGNFLKEGFDLDPNSERWDSLEQVFEASLSRIDSVPSIPNRRQDRSTEVYDIQKGVFVGVPDTDWVLAKNRAWLAKVIEKWKNTDSIFGATSIPVSGLAKERRQIRQSNWQGCLPWQYTMADVQDYEEAIAQGKASSWLHTPAHDRIQVLRQVAVELQKNRGDLIGVGLAEVGKLVKELDTEISEAIDFANYYAHSMEQMGALQGVSYGSGGVNLVLSPWNFPIAIPAGGVLASLVTGNAVILKPSLNVAACAYALCKSLWDAGVPKDALFFLPAEEATLDPFLKEGNVFDAVILTGGTDTAKMLLDRNPRLHLYAETGGKNATIVTALADREQAVKNVIQSAFGNAGQKCSATSLLILVREVYEDENFKKLLRDALMSKKVGSPWELDSQIGPLATPANQKLLSLLQNTPASKWLIQPRVEGHFMTPGVLWDIEKTDIAYQQELFGPVLCVMVADNLEEAIELVNGLEFGLTSGLESLDEEEIKLWRSRVHVGNLYVNRSTTGAIVQRQPFGGVKLSCFGFGMKAGGPHYLSQFLKPVTQLASVGTVSVPSFLDAVIDHLTFSEIDELTYAWQDFQTQYRAYFSKEMDLAKVRGQYNVNSYLKPTKVILATDAMVPTKYALLVYMACKVLNIPLEVALLHNDASATAFEALSIPIKFLTTWEELDMRHDVVLRALNKQSLPDGLLRKAHEKAIHIYGDQPRALGSFELLNYLTEQCFSYSFHRYGNLMGKE